MAGRQIDDQQCNHAAFLTMILPIPLKQQSHSNWLVWCPDAGAAGLVEGWQLRPLVEQIGHN